MKIFSRIKQKADLLKKEILTIFYAYQHPDLKFLPKIIILFALAYALSPIDLIPDFIPVIGYLDDLIILPLLISLSIKLIPEEIIIQSRAKAEKEPVKLKKKWIVAVFIIIFWAAVLFYTVYSFCTFLN